MFKSDIDSTLSYKLLKIVFSIYFIAAIIITAIHVYITYGDAKEQIKRELHDTERSFKPALATAIWELNNTQLETIANGILQINYITGIVIKNNKGEILFEKGIDHSGDRYGSFFHDFSVIHTTQTERYYLADVRLYTSTQMVIDRIYVGVVVLVINAVIKTVILWLLLLWAFKKYIFKPLNQLVHGLESIDLTDSKPHLIELETRDRNELKQIETSFNQMSAFLAQQKEELLQFEKSHSDELRREVERQTKQLKQANIELKKSNDAKSEFLAVMSHEIRTPLNGALSMIKLLERTELTPEQQECVDAINFSSETLLSIISDVLDMSAIESGNLQIEYTDFDLRGLVKSMVALFHPNAKAGNNRLSFRIDDSIPVNLCGDPSRLRQLLFNLIGNALKFTESGEIEVNVSRLNNADSKEAINLLFEVKDSGIGVSDEAMATIFKPFTQADSSINRRFGGSGLGLTICKYIVEKMGGSIGVESREGGGSTFWFKVEFSRPSGCRSGNPQAASGGGISEPSRGMNILLVEDDPINQRAETALLQIAGHNVTTANDGYSALKILAEITADQPPPFDIILMDIHMPGLNGIETTRRIRQMPGAVSQLPVIALTADVTRHNIDECLSSGINKVISKPIKHDELAESFRTFME